MNRQLPIWQLISNSLQQQVAVMLLYVLQSEGSSPGRQGFFMVVNAAGETAGSIGGGIMEHKFIEMAKERLQEQVARHREQDTRLQESGVLPEENDITIKPQYHNKSAPANQSGMICSGEQTILMYPVSAKDAEAVHQITSSLQQNLNGTLQLSPSGLQFSRTIPETDYFFSMMSPENWLYQEKTGYKNHLHVVGAGHCALALCRTMANMDFYIHLYDDRSNLKTFQENNSVHEKKIVDDYVELKELIPSGNNVYVVVMTVGYRTDDIAIRAIWDKIFRYVGLLGSKSKIEKMFTDYKTENVSDEMLRSIHAPIGIPIHSQTPEEIAISIAAEIIRVKNDQN